MPAGGRLGCSLLVEACSEKANSINHEPRSSCRDKAWHEEGTQDLIEGHCLILVKVQVEESHRVGHEQVTRSCEQPLLKPRNLQAHLQISDCQASLSVPLLLHSVPYTYIYCCKSWNGQLKLDSIRRVCTCNVFQEEFVATNSQGRPGHGKSSQRDLTFSLVQTAESAVLAGMSAQRVQWRHVLLILALVPRSGSLTKTACDSVG